MNFCQHQTNMLHVHISRDDCLEVIALRGKASEAQRRAYALADNRLSLSAGWDHDLLRIELTELKGLGVDLDLTGFGELELDALLNPDASETDPDEAPEPPANTVSRRGDLWINPDSRAAKRLPTRYADYPLRAGDIFRLDTPGGGGHGDPLARDAERVLADVREGLVSREAAERDYGVVLEPTARSWVIDRAATHARRAQLRRERAKR